MLRLFPNVMSIKIIEPILDRKCEILLQFHQFFHAHLFYGIDLQDICLINPSFISNAANTANTANTTNTTNTADIPNEIISQYGSMFFKSGWTITMNDNNNMIRILKQNQSPRRHHEKSQSTPNVKGSNDDPFGQKMEQINHSANVLINENEQELYENDSNYTDVTANTFTSVHIKMKIKNKDGKELEVEFDFNQNDNPQQIATEMINELQLPYTNACIPPHTNYKKKIHPRTNRPQSTSKMLSLSNVTLISCKYPDIDPVDNNNDNVNNQQQKPQLPQTQIISDAKSNDSIHIDQHQQQQHETPSVSPTKRASDSKLAVIHEHQNIKKEKHVKISGNVNVYSNDPNNPNKANNGYHKAKSMSNVNSEQPLQPLNGRKNKNNYIWCWL